MSLSGGERTASSGMGAGFFMRWECREFGPSLGVRLGICLMKKAEEIKNDTYSFDRRLYSYFSFL